MGQIEENIKQWRKDWKAIGDLDGATEEDGKKVKEFLCNKFEDHEIHY